MEESRKNWPVIMGITAGIVGGIVAAVYLYSTRTDGGSEVPLRDAREIIAQCHEKIQEIEASIKALRQPVTA